MTAEGQKARPGNGSSGPEIGTLAYEFETAFRHHRAGRLDQAERRYRRILRRDPGNPEALNMMGVAAGQRGKPGEAIDLLRQAVEADGLNPDYHYNLAMACQAANDLDGAKAGYRRALELEPDHADALKGLGGVHLLGGELGEAEACCRQALDLAPDDALAHYNLSTVLLARIDLEGAAASAREALRLAPDLAGGHANLGTAQLGLEAYDDASACFREALRLDPRNAEAHNNLALALIARGRIEEALASIRQALAVRPGYVEAHCNLGNACRELGYLPEAVAAFREADRLRPGDAKALTGLGLALADRGESAAAIAQFDRVLDADAGAPGALAGKASLLMLTGDTEACHAMVGPIIDAGDPAPSIAAVFAAIAPAIGRRSEAAPLLEAMLGRDDLTTEGRRLLHFALGRLYDGDDAFDDAFGQFAEGNRLRASAFEPTRFAARVERIIAFYSAANLARLLRATIPSELPVFIVGMPRSGTTLVEQILDSHPAFFGAGELDHIPRLTHILAGGPGREDAYPECVEQADGARLDGFVEAHLADLAKRGGDAHRVSDKMPYNFLHLGLISQLYPGARVIHCRRDPLDTCLSCYFQNFRRGNFQTYELGHLGQYFVQYQRLMDHWREVLDIRILDVAYEDVVADLEGQSRRLVDFVGLEWDRRCLRFYDSDRLVSTASYDQVRQPIYTRSVGRWRHYERRLGPLRAALDPVL